MRVTNPSNAQGAERAAMVMHLNFNRTYIKKIYDGEDPDDGTVGMAGFLK